MIEKIDLKDETIKEIINKLRELAKQLDTINTTGGAKSAVDELQLLKDKIKTTNNLK